MNQLEQFENDENLKLKIINTKGFKKRSHEGEVRGPSEKEISFSDGPREELP
jgi:hypothetical protein